MSFTLPSIKSKPSLPDEFGLSEGTFGVPDVMTNGLTSAKSTVNVLHPIEQSEINYRNNQRTLNMTVLRNTQGLHAPLRIAMEMRAAKRVGHLPFLASSNALFDSLTGRDLEIDASDVFVVPEFQEVCGLPHAVVEKSVELF